MAILLSSITASAYDFEVDGIYYNITSASDLTVAVTSGDNKYTGEVIIPETISYKSKVLKVTSIGGHAFDGCTGLTSIVIPNSVTSIGVAALQSCTGLTSVEIPNSVTSIGGHAFAGCTGLTSIEIPNSVTSIGREAFLYCSGLTSVTIPNSVTSIGSSAFFGCSSLTSIEIPNRVTSIGDYTFYGCSSLADITIGKSVAIIGVDAFYDCKNIKHIEFNCQTVENWFRYKNSIERVVFGDNVKRINENAFESCANLERIIIGSKVSYIGNKAFYSCNNLKTVINCSDIIELYKYGTYVTNYADNVINVPNGFVDDDFVFNSEKALVAYLGNDTELRLPQSCNGENYVISNEVFRYNNNLTSVTIPNNIIGIENEAFEGCYNLKDVHISDLSAWCNIEFGGYYANPFYYADNLYLNGELVTEIIIPDDITEIKKYAFYGCSCLTSIVIPNNVTSIGGHAFDGCTGLTSIEIPNSVTNIGFLVFNNCYRLTDVHISDLSAWCNIEFGDYYANPLSYAENLYLNNELVTELVIPNDITEIKKYAFYGCSGLTSITIPGTITNIGYSAFNGCTGLTSIYLLGDNAPTVGNYNFKESQYVNMTLYVPKGTLATYQSADIWKNFWDIQEFDATEIDDIKASNIAIEVTVNGISLANANGKTVAVYTANGTRVANINNYAGDEIALNKGVYIVRVGNDTIKVII